MLSPLNLPSFDSRIKNFAESVSYISSSQDDILTSSTLDIIISLFNSFFDVKLDPFEGLLLFLNDNISHILIFSYFSNSFEDIQQKSLSLLCNLAYHIPILSSILFNISSIISSNFDSKNLLSLSTAIFQNLKTVSEKLSEIIPDIDIDISKLPDFDTKIANLVAADPSNSHTKHLYIILECLINIIPPVQKAMAENKDLKPCLSRIAKNMNTKFRKDKLKSILEDTEADINL